ncbi:MAG: hypothetical protein HQL98_01465 [Magnetococcales bacterium]|nr:hypothetical protein [Magnetococcales bacterium]
MNILSPDFRSGHHRRDPGRAAAGCADVAGVEESVPDGMGAAEGEVGFPEIADIANLWPSGKSVSCPRFLGFPDFFEFRDFPISISPPKKRTKI